MVRIGKQFLMVAAGMVLLGQSVGAQVVCNPNNASASNTPISYTVLIKKIILCPQGQVCDYANGPFLYDGAGKEIDIASFGKGGFERIVGPDQIIKAGTYDKMAFLLSSTINVKGVVNVNGEYCYTTTVDNNNKLCTQAHAPVGSEGDARNNAVTVGFQLPNMSKNAAQYKYDISGSDFKLEFTLANIISVPQDVRMGDVTEQMGLFFNVDAGVKAYIDTNQCFTILGSPTITFKIGDTAVIPNVTVGP
ncbi:hypothetical protein [Thermopetrobacter sp. TC1]|uniref:hypothetical protein n=1 Tax=Thermopetrobacter sp. TC1 TaxID=1495045 RepID=UPI0012E09F89|nr:hypothetical protein [Thermopetrobacter sp. TC1]